MKNENFNPNAAATEDSGIFGLPNTELDSGLVFIPVPWDATTSYKRGTAKGPQAILQASRQVDLYDLEVLRPYEAGFFMLPESPEVRSWNEEATAELGDHGSPCSQARVNGLSKKLNHYVYSETKRLLADNKYVGIVGGEHSVPFGALQAMAEKHSSFGVLHFDAHSDTRERFEGFDHSHASIFNNVLTNIPAVTKLVQVGIRDFCEEEMEFCHSQKNRVEIFFDRRLAAKKFSGISWQETAQEIIKSLPEKVWVSFDIDGLDPKLCPNTGTPVPGGLEFNEACFILSALARSGRKIIGFDLSEVAPEPGGVNEWDANVGARLLYQLSAWLLVSQGKCKQ